MTYSSTTTVQIVLRTGVVSKSVTNANDSKDCESFTNDFLTFPRYRIHWGRRGLRQPSSLVVDSNSDRVLKVNRMLLTLYSQCNQTPSEVEIIFKVHCGRSGGLFVGRSCPFRLVSLTST